MSTAATNPSAVNAMLASSGELIPVLGRGLRLSVRLHDTEIKRSKEYGREDVVPPRVREPRDGESKAHRRHEPGRNPWISTLEPRHGQHNNDENPSSDDVRRHSSALRETRSAGRW